MNYRPLQLVTLVFAASCALATSVCSGENCGCSAGPAGNYCNGGCVKVIHHHHGRKHCHSCCPQQDRSVTRELPPAGPVLETVPMRMMPMMAAPMMYAPVAAQRVAYVEEAPRPREMTCESSTSRLAQLESRFDLLHQRVDSLQDTIKTQTEILVEIKRKLDAPR